MMPTNAQIDAAVTEANRRIAEHAGRLGHPAAAAGLQAVAGSQGTVLIYRIRGTAEGDRCDAEHLGVTDDTRNPLDEPADHTLRVAVQRHVRRSLRNRMIADAGAPGSEPTWSFTMHRIARRWLMETGVDPAIATAGTVKQNEVDFLIGYMARQADLTVGKLHREDGRIGFEGIIDGHLHFTDVSGPRIIVSRTLPDSMVGAMPGRLVSEVIDHHAVRKAGPVRIASARCEGGSLTLDLADTQDFIRRPPPGSDRAWASIPFHDVARPVRNPI